jgi:hypothetical protein
MIKNLIILVLLTAMAWTWYSNSTIISKEELSMITTALHEKINAIKKELQNKLNINEQRNSSSTDPADNISTNTKQKKRSAVKKQTYSNRDIKKTIIEKNIKSNNFKISEQEYAVPSEKNIEKQYDGWGTAKNQKISAPEKNIGEQYEGNGKFSKKDMETVMAILSSAETYLTGTSFKEIIPKDQVNSNKKQKGDNPIKKK